MRCFVGTKKLGSVMAQHTNMHEIIGRHANTVLPVMLCTAASPV